MYHLLDETYIHVCVNSENHKAVITFSKKHKEPSTHVLTYYDVLTLERMIQDIKEKIYEHNKK